MRGRGGLLGNRDLCYQKRSYGELELLKQGVLVLETCVQVVVVLHERSEQVCQPKQLERQLLHRRLRLHLHDLATALLPPPAAVPLHAAKHYVLHSEPLGGGVADAEHVLPASAARPRWVAAAALHGAVEASQHLGDGLLLQVLARIAALHAGLAPDPRTPAPGGGLDPRSRRHRHDFHVAQRTSCTQRPLHDLRMPLEELQIRPAAGSRGAKRVVPIEDDHGLVTVAPTVNVGPARPGCHHRRRKLPKGPARRWNARHV
mmetsp:Transcript_43163/g.122051  ORF Transcript_43163/g.122051 Transcript_43163/m.122051 type:complete len:260 (-) Transcript_43163:236-1015(-)